MSARGCRDGLRPAALASGLLFVQFAFCGPASADKGFVMDTIPELERYAYISSAAVWVWPAGARKVVFVCWENPDTSNVGGRSVVKSAVENTWQANSQLMFQGWAECRPNNHGIRIRIADAGPHTKGLGRQLDGKKDGMVLNFTFGTFSTSCAKTEAKRNECIRKIAVHEFGHALGWSHEQNRWDAPGECAQQAQGPNGDVLLTPYDKDSVMNYCNELWNNDGQLSKYDLIALQNLYGVPQ